MNAEIDKSLENVKRCLARKAAAKAERKAAPKFSIESLTAPTAGDDPVQTSNSRYLSCAETAIIVRARLKALWPKVKFSVRSSTYSGGASIDVHWTDGPALSEVDAVLDNYEGSGFDGSIDLKYSYTSWLYPDGTAHVAKSSGTSASRGYVSPIMNDPEPGKGAILVHFGADYVKGSRTMSKELQAKAVEEFEAWSGRKVDREKCGGQAVQVISWAANRPLETENETWSRALRDIEQYNLWAPVEPANPSIMESLVECFV